MKKFLGTFRGKEMLGNDAVEQCLDFYVKKVAELQAENLMEKVRNMREITWWERFGKELGFIK